MVTRNDRCINFNNNLVLSWFDSIIQKLPTNMTHENESAIWFRLSQHNKLAVEVLEKYPEKPWRWSAVTQTFSKNAMHIILSRPDLPWKYDYISGDQLTTDILLNYPHLPFCIYNVICHNPKLMTDEVFNLYKGKFSSTDLYKVYEKYPHLLKYNCNQTIDINKKGDIKSQVSAIPALNYKDLSAHPSCTLKLVAENNNANWDRVALATNKNIKLHGYDLYKLKLPGCELSRRSDITMDIIKANPKIQWDWNILSGYAIYCGKIKITDVLDNPHMPWVWRIEDKPSDFPEKLIDNTVTFINNHINNDTICTPHAIYNLCKVPGMHKRYDIIKKYIDKSWDWDYISENYILTLDDIINSNGKIILEKIPLYNITIDIINAFPNHKWNYSMMINNANIPLDLIISKCGHAREFWTNRMTYCIRLNEQILDKYCDMPFDWNGMSDHPWITVDIVIKYIHKPWNWEKITKNSRHFDIFNIDFEKYKTTKIKEYLAAYRIQQWWLHIMSNPRHSVGKRLLERAYECDFNQ